MQRACLKAFTCIFLLFNFETTGRAAPLASIHVESGDLPLEDAPVSVSFGELGLKPADEFHLVEITGGKAAPVPCQAEMSESPRLVWILGGLTEPRSRRDFRLLSGASSTESEVRIDDDGQSLTLTVGGKPALRYNHATVPPPAGANARFARSGFVHPLWSPAGQALTEIHPPDHIHHLGLWGPWTKTLYEERSIDFWNLNQGEGTVRFARWLERSDGPVYAKARALQEHVWLQAPEGKRVVLNEIVEMRVWNVGDPDDEGWMIDYSSVYQCATDQPLLLEAYRYGGFGFRGTSRWNIGNSDYLTSSGKTRLDGDGSRARWCDVFGDTGAGVEGILFMSHPENYEHPEPMRIWPASSNGGRGDVFFNFCPIRFTDWLIEPGKEYHLKYRLWVHSGKLSPTDADRRWNGFAHPPQVTVTRDRR